MRVAIYARCSSERQAEKDLSIPAQIKALEKHSLKNGWDVVRKFVDEAESARTVDRPAFQEMIALAKQKEPPFEAILVWKLSRFARNREDSVLYKALLRKKGVQVLSMNEPIDDSPAGKLLEGVLESMDEFFSANLGQDTRRGMRENVSRGFHNGGPAPYGFKTAQVEVNGVRKRKLDLNALEAPVVRQMKKLCLQGEGVKEIVNRLNAEGKRTRQGNPWSKTGVYHILTNPVYTGALVWGKTRYSQGIRTKNPHEEIVCIPNAHPAIIPKAEFDEIQRLLSRRGPKITHPRSVASPHLLSGLLFCARCGSKVIAIGAKSGKFTYYTCLASWRQGKAVCHAKMLNTDKFETFIINVIKERILTEEHLVKLIELISEELKVYKSEAKEKLELLQRKLADTERRLGKLYRLIEDDKMSFEEVAPRLRELNALKEQLLAEQKTLGQGAEQAAIPCPPKEEVRRYVEDLRETLEEGSLMERKGFLRSWIKRIDLNHPNAEIEYALLLTPPKAVNPVRREVLSIVQSGCPAWIRTMTP